MLINFTGQKVTTYWHHGAQSPRMQVNDAINRRGCRARHVSPGGRSNNLSLAPFPLASWRLANFRGTPSILGGFFVPLFNLLAPFFLGDGCPVFDRMHCQKHGMAIKNFGAGNRREPFLYVCVEP
ncbi:hypothetical protein CEXT_571591 [Caerostris extrusa]|uniref:Uncharacterized protein n=1 Tax=Caerostris extrusa TaxID=172846 RepID=A0AAV4WG80_CAEEX|nr:hypothetical protein CEXT_571591 [Caerostris extrusa]